MRGEIRKDVIPKIWEICDHLQADLDKKRIEYATAYLLHDVQENKKVKLQNFESHVASYTLALDEACDKSFGSIETLSATEIEKLTEDSDNSDTSNANNKHDLKNRLRQAATTPEDV